MDEKKDEILPPPPGMQQRTQQQIPPQQQYYAPPPPQQYYRRNYGGFLKNPVYIVLGVAIPILLMWLGVLLYAIGIGSDNSTPFMQMAVIFYSLGTAGISMFLIILGIGRGDIPQWVRTALIFGAVIILTWGFVFLYPLLGVLGGAIHTP